MKKEKNNSKVGLIGITTIVFTTLKLIEYIDWSWAWVFSPVWISMLIIVIGGILKNVFKSSKRNTVEQKLAEQAADNIYHERKSN